VKMDDAKAECERWLAYLERQDQKCAEIQEIAADLRAEKCSEDEARRRLRQIDSKPVVFEGSRLREAVLCLLAHLK